MLALAEEELLSVCWLPGRHVAIWALGGGTPLLFMVLIAVLSGMAELLPLLLALISLTLAPQSVLLLTYVLA